MRKKLVWALTAALTLLSCESEKTQSTPRALNIKLALLITVDQLRGDMLLRFQDRFGQDGFRFLMDRGVYYTNAHYRHSNTLTAPGHATLFTGGHTAQHGIPGNDWYDSEAGRRVYCVEDDRHRLIGEETNSHAGTSPRNLESNTVGDQLFLATNGQAKVFSISAKDRGAIIPGGHEGAAFWYSRKTGRFITSTYYYEQMPAWVADWNRDHGAGTYGGQVWRLSQDEDEYAYADDRVAERAVLDIRNTFPHALSDHDSVLFTQLRYTPFMDRMVTEFAKAAVEREQLGQRGQVDMLSISFSATDWIGHVFGPNSREAEDNLIRLDRTLAELFRVIDEKVGLEQTLIVLSSDHGVDEIPEARLARNLHAGRVDDEGMIERANALLRSRYNCSENLIQVFYNPSVYLNRRVIKALGLDASEVAQAAAGILREEPGIALALTGREIGEVRAESDSIVQKIRKSIHPDRSGEIFLVQAPSWVLATSTVSAMHGSPYAYDTHVPILFAGPGIRARRVDRSVAPSDVAATVCAYLGIRPPSGSVGEPLAEVHP